MIKTDLLTNANVVLDRLLAAENRSWSGILVDGRVENYEDAEGEESLLVFGFWNGGRPVNDELVSATSDFSLALIDAFRSDGIDLYPYTRFRSLDDDGHADDEVADDERGGESILDRCE